LTEQAWSIKDLIYGFRRNFFAERGGYWIPSGQDNSIFDLVFLQQEKPRENVIHGIIMMFSYYQSQSKGIHLN